MSDNPMVERLARQRLEQPQPPSAARAREQLNRAGIKVAQVVRALPEAILFVNESGVAMTAWSQVRESGAVVFYCEAGFAAFPNDYVIEG